MAVIGTRTRAPKAPDTLHGEGRETRIFFVITILEFSNSVVVLLTQAVTSAFLMQVEGSFRSSIGKEAVSCKVAATEMFTLISHFSDASKASLRGGASVESRDLNQEIEKVVLLGGTSMKSSDLEEP